MTNSERKREEAENRVRKVLRQIPREYIQDFYIELSKNLRNAGSKKTVAEMLRETETHPH